MHFFSLSDFEMSQIGNGETGPLLFLKEQEGRRSVYAELMCLTALVTRMFFKETKTLTK